MQKIIVLDRDGVINYDADEFIKSADEWRPLPGSLEAIARLKSHGWWVAVATNQSGIKRGYYSRHTLSAMHQKMQAGLVSFGVKGVQGVDWVSYSPYLTHDHSPSRKPGLGMLQAIEQRFGLSLAGAPMVGDTLADVQAALGKAMQPVLVKTGKGERTLQTQHPLLQQVTVFDDLYTAVEDILK